MAVGFASRGPAGKRDAVKHGHRTAAELSEQYERGAEIVWPAPPGDLTNAKDATRWHAYAEAWYFSLQMSGQRIFYEQSDVALAYLTAEQMSRLLKPQMVGFAREWNSDARQMELVPTWVKVPMKGDQLNSILKAMTQLLATEADRRRAGIELAAGTGGTQEDDSTAEAQVFQLLQGGAGASA